MVDGETGQRLVCFGSIGGVGCHWWRYGELGLAFWKGSGVWFVGERPPLHEGGQCRVQSRLVKNAVVRAMACLK